MAALALVAGLGVGFTAGLVFGMMYQFPKLLGFLHDQTDRFLTTALFPGLKGVVETPASQPAEEMYLPEDVDDPQVPAWLSEDDTVNAWDYSRE